MLSQIWNYLFGHVTVELEGGSPETFINAANRKGITLWSLSVQDGRYRFTCSIAAFHQLRPIRRQSRTSLRIVERGGLPFFIRRLRRRKGWVAGLVLALVLLYAATSFVWFVEIEGLEDLSEAEVRQELAAYGLEPGAWKGAVDFRHIAGRLPIEHEDIVWASVQVRGTKVTVEVVEERRPPEEERRGPSDIVATRPAVVEEILVLRGMAAVSVGDRVTPGDVLVTGAIRVPVPPSTDHGPRYRISGWREARAEVVGRVWYEDYREMPLTEERVLPTGRTFTTYRLVIANRHVPLVPAEAIPYDEYRIDVQPLGPTGMGLDHLPVRAERLHIREVTVHQVDVPPRVARQRAVQQLRERVATELERGEIVEARGEEVQRNDDYVGVRVTVETLEQIGRVQPVDWEGGG